MQKSYETQYNWDNNLNTTSGYLPCGNCVARVDRILTAFSDDFVDSITNNISGFLATNNGQKLDDGFYKFTNVFFDTKILSINWQVYLMDLIRTSAKQTKGFAKISNFDFINNIGDPYAEYNEGGEPWYMLETLRRLDNGDATVLYYTTEDSIYYDIFVPTDDPKYNDGFYVVSVVLSMVYKKPNSYIGFVVRERTYDDFLDNEFELDLTIPEGY